MSMRGTKALHEANAVAREARERRAAARKRAEEIHDDRVLRVAKVIRLGMAGLRKVRCWPWEELVSRRPKLAKRYMDAARLAIIETNLVVPVQWKGKMTAGKAKAGIATDE